MFYSSLDIWLMLCRVWDQLCSPEEKIRWCEEAVKLEGIEPHILSVWWVAAEIPVKFFVSRCCLFRATSLSLACAGNSAEESRGFNTPPAPPSPGLTPLGFLCFRTSLLPFQPLIFSASSPSRESTSQWDCQLLFYVDETWIEEFPQAKPPPTHTLLAFLP